MVRAAGHCAKQVSTVRSEDLRELPAHGGRIRHSHSRLPTAAMRNLDKVGRPELARRLRTATLPTACTSDRPRGCNHRPLDDAAALPRAIISRLHGRRSRVRLHGRRGRVRLHGRRSRARLRGRRSRVRLRGRRSLSQASRKARPNHHSTRAAHPLAQHPRAGVLQTTAQCPAFPLRSPPARRR